MEAHGSGGHALVNKQKSKTERAARRKTALPPSERQSDTVPPPPFSATDALSPPPSLPSSNGDEESALARLVDDGGPPAPADEPLEPPTAGAPEPPATPSLEQRIQRLEEAVTLLQDRRASKPPVAAVPVAPPPAPTAIRLDVNKASPPAVPMATHVPAAVPSLVHSVTRGNLLAFLWDTWAEARAIVRMFVDPRYSLPWSARALPLVLLAAILTSKFWVPFASIPFLGDWFLVKLVDLLIAFLLFKWLGHEARRYRQTSPDLPSNLRL